MPIRPGAGSAYEKVERRAGDWAVAAAGAFVQLDGGPSPTPGSASPRSAPSISPAQRPRPCCAAEPPTPRTDRGRRDRLPGRLQPPEPTSGARWTTSVTWWVLVGRALTRAFARARGRRRLMHVTMTVNGQEIGARRGAPAASRPLPPRSPRAQGHPLGLRHLQLRSLHRVARRRPGQELHHAGRSWPTATRCARSRISRPTECSIRSRKDSSRSTACSAGSAPRGC